LPLRSLVRRTTSGFNASLTSSIYKSQTTVTGLTYLERKSEIIKKLLHSSRTMLIKRNRNNRRSHKLDQLRALGIITSLQQLLTQIISKGIRHQLCEKLFRAIINDFNGFLVTSIQFALQVSTSILISAQIRDLCSKVLDARAYRLCVLELPRD